MVAQVEERRLRPLRHPSISDRLWILAGAVMRIIAPYVAFPGRCRYCGVKQLLIKELVSVYEGGFLVHHSRVWQCPECEDRSVDACVYFRDLDIWEHS